MITMLLKIFFNCTMYKIGMSTQQIYEYFLNDMKSKIPNKISLKFYQGLSGLEQDIVDCDVRSYRLQCNNSSVQLGFKYHRSDSSIKYIRAKLKKELHDTMYQSIYHDYINNV